MIFCKYANIFGKPGEGAHSYRILNIAAVDAILTIFLAVYANKHINNIYISLFAMFVLSIFFHFLFGVKTTVTKYMF
jgi:hypothetical protein